MIKMLGTLRKTRGFLNIGKKQIWSKSCINKAIMADLSKHRPQSYEAFAQLIFKSKGKGVPACCLASYDCL